MLSTAPTQVPAGRQIPTAVSASSESAVASPSEEALPLHLTGIEELAALEAVKRVPRDNAALAYALGGACPDAPPGCPRVARTTPLEVQVGDQEEFWVTSFSDNRNYTVTAELRYAGPVVLMYVEEGFDFDQAALERATRAFEEEIYPRTRALFGSEEQPGVDGDARITVLNAHSTGGVLGYFSERDTVPQSVNRFSNEREMFFMNAGTLYPGNSDYLDVLAHELQHMIHWNEQRGSPTWFNEGSSILAEDLNGFINQGYAQTYLKIPDTQLTAWERQPQALIAHYGAASLFLRYLFAQYTGEEGILPLIRADAGNNLEVFAELAAQTRPDISSFEDLFTDWAVANLFDNPAIGDGRYTYATGHNLPKLLPFKVEPEPMSEDDISAAVHQYGVDYLELPPGPLTLSFTGDTTVGLTGATPQDNAAWWSGRGDDSISTLTRAFDLRSLSQATLQFTVWHELENSYDYAFVSVSRDGGVTWQTLAGTSTTDDDPQGVNFGHGLTGVSGDPNATIGEEVRGVWVDETMDLTPYVGQEILLRFWQISDLAINGPGLLVDDIAIPELGYADDFVTGPSGWQGEGFVRVDGDLSQMWTLRLVRTGSDGQISVEKLALDADGQVSADLAAGERGVLIVSATTPHTTELGNYRLQLIR
jgi:hypothetical protein